MLMVAMGRVTTSLEIPKRLFRRPEACRTSRKPKKPVSTVRKEACQTGRKNQNRRTLKRKRGLQTGKEQTLLSQWGPARPKIETGEN